MTLKLNIVCEDEKYLPVYANETDACMDLKVKIPEPSCYFLRPNEIATFSTGIKVSVPEEHIMLIFPRSSTGFKLNCRLTNSTGIIDAGYRDEIKLSLFNFGKETICLNDAQRIAQFVIIPRPKVELKLVEDDEQFRAGDRCGGIGSTGETKVVNNNHEQSDKVIIPLNIFKKIIETGITEGRKDLKTEPEQLADFIFESLKDQNAAVQ